jgi:hypothetical protein
MNLTETTGHWTCGVWFEREVNDGGPTPSRFEETVAKADMGALNLAMEMLHAAEVLIDKWYEQEDRMKSCSGDPDVTVVAATAPSRRLFSAPKTRLKFADAIACARRQAKH